MLNSKNLAIQKIGLQLLKFEKSYYTKNDIVLYYKIAEILKNFNHKSEELENGKWLCYCGKKNSRRSDRCSSCKCDKTGFKAYESTSMQIFGELRNRVGILKSYLPSAKSV